MGAKHKQNHGRTDGRIDICKARGLVLGVWMRETVILVVLVSWVSF